MSDEASTSARPSSSVTRLRKGTGSGQSSTNIASAASLPLLTSSEGSPNVIEELTQNPLLNRSKSAVAVLGIFPFRGREMKETVVAAGPKGSSDSRRPAKFVQYAPYVLDLVGLAICLIVAVTTDAGTPRTAFVVRTYLRDNNNYPYSPDTVPSWSVPVFAILGPLLCYAAYKWIYKRSHYEVYRLSVNFLFACLLTGALTGALKISVGRLRPNFAVKCWPDGNQKFSQVGNLDINIVANAICDPSVKESIQHEIRKSWPSGHSSWSAAGLGYFTLFLLGQMRAWAGDAWSWQVLLALCPSFGAIAVGVTRIIDYWHHPSDVITGLCLGFGIAFIIYRQMYPSLTHPNCDQPLYVLQHKYSVYANVCQVMPMGDQARKGRENAHELVSVPPTGYADDPANRV